jgi:periplasmic copper chaperone A
MKPTVLLLAVAGDRGSRQRLQDGRAGNPAALDACDPQRGEDAAGYVAIKNTGSAPDRLTGGSLTGAGGAQVHEMTTDHGVMKMRPMLDGIEIKPGETVELKPGGLHLMFTDLKARLVKGQSVEGTLTFANAGTVDVEFAVEGMGATAGTGAHGMQMDHMQMH